MHDEEKRDSGHRRDGRKNRRRPGFRTGIAVIAAVLIIASVTSFCSAEDEEADNGVVPIH